MDNEIKYRVDIIIENAFSGINEEKEITNTVMPFQFDDLDSALEYVNMNYVGVSNFNNTSHVKFIDLELETEKIIKTITDYNELVEEYK